jgi:hypothetical protein
MIYEMIGDLCILVHGEVPPSNEEWNEYLAGGSERLSGLASPKCIVVTDGVAPSPTQRVALNAVVAEYGRPVPTAVITRSVVARSAVTVLGWFNSAIRSFAPNELSAAMLYLGIEPARRSDLVERIVRMRIALSNESSPLDAPIDLRQIADEMESLLVRPLPLLRNVSKR